MKLFISSDLEIIERCIYFFHADLPSVQLQKRFQKCLVDAANKHLNAYIAVAIAFEHCISLAH